MIHAAMRVLLAQHMADTGENVFVRKFPMHSAGVFQAQKASYCMQHWDADSYQQQYVITLQAYFCALAGLWEPVSESITLKCGS